MQRREFLQLLYLAASSGMALHSRALLAGNDDAALYEVAPYGNVHLLHFTDCHAQLLPLYYREPDTCIGIGPAHNQPPHLVGEALLRTFGISPGTAEAYALSSLDFAEAAHRYGKTGGFAHLATLIKLLRTTRPGALLLDGGDTWQGSATALWTQGQDMVEASRLMGVYAMSAHWEFTLGTDRVRQIVDTELKGRTAFLAQNVKTDDFSDPVFEGIAYRVMNGIKIAVIGQAFPYTPVAHPRRLMAGWRFGLDEVSLQQAVQQARTQGAQAVVLLSHNGMDVDLKMASRISGLDAILGGHTHDAVPAPVMVNNAGGKTLVINSGSHGKFLSVLDLDVRQSRVQGYQFRLLPVFSHLLPPDPEMAAHIEAVRKPFLDRLTMPLGVSEGVLYRRGNFNGSWDQLILDALREVKDAEVAFSPGFRWGATLLPGEQITFEDVMNQTAITYPSTTVTKMSGSEIKAYMENVCDNLFNPDPYLQEGGDMVRTGGLRYVCAPAARMGDRIRQIEVGGKPLDASRLYKVAGWAPVTNTLATGEPVWEVVVSWLRHHHTVPALAPQQRVVTP